MKTLVRKPYYSFADGRNIFDEIFGYGGIEKHLAPTSPAVNIYEKEEGYSVEMALPGHNKEEVKVELKENMLTISSEHALTSEGNNGKYTRKEFEVRSFNRKFRFPEKVIDVDKIHANMENGILRIVLPKLQKEGLTNIRSIIVE